MSRSRQYQIGRYTTLLERSTDFSERLGPEIVPVILPPPVVAFFKTLESNEGDLRLTIPRWGEGHYSVELAYFPKRPASEEQLFFEPYNPLVVDYFPEGSKEGVHIGVIYDIVLFARDADHAAYLDEEFLQITLDVEGYFAKTGKRWGRCLVCGRALTAASSVAEAVGKVCYKKLGGFTKAVEDSKKINDYALRGVGVLDLSETYGVVREEDSLSYEQRGIEILYEIRRPKPKSGLTYRDLLNETEKKGYDAIQLKLATYGRVGAVYDQNGVFHPLSVAQVYTVTPTTIQLNEDLTRDLHEGQITSVRKPPGVWVLTSTKKKGEAPKATKKDEAVKKIPKIDVVGDELHITEASDYRKELKELGALWKGKRWVLERSLLGKVETLFGK